jgi:molecular chaperone DnaK
VEIKVYQGERAMARDNRLLGVFQLVGIPPAPRGVPQIEVTFDIDANGILHVTAKDRATGNEQKITITSSSGLSKDEVDKMARDAEAHRAEDERRRQEVEAKNQLDNAVYSAEKMLREHRDKISDSDARNIEEAVSEAKKAIEEGGLERIRAAQDRLMQASHKLAEAMYRAAGAQQPSGDGASGARAESAKKDDVVDAEFVDVDDQKK